MNDFIMGVIIGIFAIKVLEYRLKKSDKYQKIANFLIGKKNEENKN